MIIRRKLLKDLEDIGLKTDFNLEIRGYSKTLEGTYDPNIEKIVIYAREENGEMREYSEVLEILIHEAIHHYQWKHDPSFVRKRGVMHNKDFHEKMNKYAGRARDKNKLREVESNDKEFIKDLGEIRRVFV